MRQYWGRGATWRRSNQAQAPWMGTPPLLPPAREPAAWSQRPCSLCLKSCRFRTEALPQLRLLWCDTGPQRPLGVLCALCGRPAYRPHWHVQEDLKRRWPTITTPLPRMTQGPQQGAVPSQKQWSMPGVPVRGSRAGGSQVQVPPG